MELGESESAMGTNEESMDGDMERACGFAMPLTTQTAVGSGSRQSQIFLHGMFFSMLRDKVVVIAHDGIHRHLMRTARLTQTACMPAVEHTASLRIG